MPESPLVIINVSIMNNELSIQNDKLTRVYSARLTEDDAIRNARLSAAGKSNVKSALIRAIRKEYHMESLDPDNPPPLNINNEE